MDNKLALEWLTQRYPGMVRDSDFGELDSEDFFDFAEWVTSYLEEKKKEFTRLHVEKALHAASNKAMLIGIPYKDGVRNEELKCPVKKFVSVMEDGIEYRYEVAAGPIITAYPISKIK